MKNYQIIELEVKKSRFVSYYFEIENIEEISLLLDKIKSQHKKAKHFCYAYILKNPYQEKCSDDGEPNGTAGKPILNVLQKSHQINALVCVVRYFGGIKLGSGGLFRAYSKATSLVVEKYTTSKKTIN